MSVPVVANESSVARTTPDGDRFRRSDAVAMACLFAGALVLRLLNLQQIWANDPFFTLPSIDARLYHEWALRIVAGDWLGADVFILGPLYPYALGILYTIVGPSIFAAKLVQMILGAATCALVYWLGCRLFDRRAGLIAGVMFAVYGMQVFYEGSLLVTNLQTPLTVGLLLVVVELLRKPTAGRALLAGVLAGLSTLARENALLFAAFVPIWLVYALAGVLTLKRRIALGALFIAAVCAVVFPVTLRNRLVADDWVLVNSTGGIVLYTGFNPDARGTYMVPSMFPRTMADDPEQQWNVYAQFAERSVGRELKPSEVSSWWSSRALEFIRQNPGFSFWLVLRKLGLFFNHYEVWNIRAYELSRQFSWVLRLPLLSFGIVAPLGLLGLALTAREWRRLTPLYAMLGTYLLSALLIFVLSRYRMPVVPIFIIFAAAALTELFDAVRQRKHALLGLAAAGLVVAAFVVHLNLTGSDYSIAHYNLGNKYKDLEKWELAIEQYRHALELAPGYISTYNNLGLVYERSGRYPVEAVQTWRRVLAMARAQNLQHYVERAERHLRELDAVP